MSETPVKASATTADARRFGFLVGGAFLVIALISWYRGKPVPLYLTFAVLGSVLALLGATIPVTLVSVFRAWMGLALVLSKVTTPILMAVIYFVVVTPIGVLRRLFGANALARQKGMDGYWVRVTPTPHSMERQF